MGSPLPRKGASDISAAPAHFAGVWIHTALVGTFTVTCLTDEAGTAANWVLPVGTVGLLPAPFSRCETSLTVQKSSATDDGRSAFHAKLNALSAAGWKTPGA